MRRFFSVIIVGLIIVSCCKCSSNQIRIDIDRALKKQVSVRDLYTQASLIPLRYPGTTSLGEDCKVVMDVSKTRLFLLDKEKNEIWVFDKNGGFVISIQSAESIIDFSVYRNQVLDVLTSNAITEYSINDGSYLVSYPIQDNDVSLKSMAKVDDDSIFMLGFRDGRAYDCGYLIDRDRFSSVASPIFSAEDYQNSRFFRCNDSTYSYSTQSGMILQFTHDDFIYPLYEWDFGRKSPIFTNAQMTDDKIYLAFQLDEEKQVLFYDLKSKKYKVVRQTKEGVSFPLGVIYAGSNYFCCQSSRLSDYLTQEMVGGTGADIYEELILSDCLVVIRYVL